MFMTDKRLVRSAQIQIILIAGLFVGCEPGNSGLSPSIESDCRNDGRGCTAPFVCIEGEEGNFDCRNPGAHTELVENGFGGLADGGVDVSARPDNAGQVSNNGADIIRDNNPESTTVDDDEATDGLATPAAGEEASDDDLSVAHQGGSEANHEAMGGVPSEASAGALSPSAVNGAGGIDDTDSGMVDPMDSPSGGRMPAGTDMPTDELPIDSSNWVCQPNEALRCGSDTGLCTAGRTRCFPDGSGFGACEGAVGPANEICDGEDNDCDGDTDEGFNLGEGCVINVGAERLTGRWRCDVDTTQRECSGIDQCFSDDDGDGFQRCSENQDIQVDCDDGNPRRNPLIPDLCDGIDNDCDTDVDEASAECVDLLDQQLFDDCIEICATTTECAPDIGTRCISQCVTAFAQSDPLAIQSVTGYAECTRTPNPDGQTVCDTVSDCVQSGIGGLQPPPTQASFCAAYEQCAANDALCSAVYDRLRDQGQAAVVCAFTTLFTECPENPSTLVQSCMPDTSDPLDFLCERHCAMGAQCGLLDTTQSCVDRCMALGEHTLDDAKAEQAGFACLDAMSCTELETCLLATSPGGDCERYCQSREGCALGSDTCVADCLGTWPRRRAQDLRTCVFDNHADCSTMANCAEAPSIQCNRFCEHQWACHQRHDAVVSRERWFQDCHGECDDRHADERWEFTDEAACTIVMDTCGSDAANQSPCTNANWAENSGCRNFCQMENCRTGEDPLGCMTECYDGFTGNRRELEFDAAQDCLNALDAQSECIDFISCYSNGLDDLTASCQFHCDRLDQCNFVDVSTCLDECALDLDLNELSCVLKTQRFAEGCDGVAACTNQPSPASTPLCDRFCELRQSCLVDTDRYLCRQACGEAISNSENSDSSADYETLLRIRTQCLANVSCNDAANCYGIDTTEDSVCGDACDSGFACDTIDNLVDCELTCIAKAASTDTPSAFKENLRRCAREARDEQGCDAVALGTCLQPILCPDFESSIIIGPEGGNYPVDLSSGTNNVELACPEADGVGKQVVAILKLEQTSSVTLEMVSSNFDSVLALASTCTSPMTPHQVIACDNGDEQRVNTHIERDTNTEPLEPGLYYVFVGGHNGQLGQGELSVEIQPLCGDGCISAGYGESCDDGNLESGDGCGESCVLEAGHSAASLGHSICDGGTCGDGHLDPGEECDSAGATARCDANCRHIPTGFGDFCNAAVTCSDTYACLTYSAQRGFCTRFCEPDGCPSGWGCGSGIDEAGATVQICIRPGDVAFGDLCESEADCESTVCVPNLENEVTSCSITCRSVEDCPADYVCAPYNRLTRACIPSAAPELPSPEGTNAACADGRDNDGDGEIDCQDDNCSNEGVHVCSTDGALRVNLDLACYGARVESVRLTGPIWGFQTDIGPLATDEDGDGIFTTTLFDQGRREDFEYRWVVNDVVENLLNAHGDDFENFDRCSSGAPVSSDGVSYANRVWQVGDPEPTDAFNSCLSCAEQASQISDRDGDGLSDEEEEELRTNPDNPDTDRDGLNDLVEVNAGLNPRERDTDGDTLDDLTEFNGNTAADLADTDGDGLRDDYELDCNFNPVVAPGIAATSNAFAAWQADGSVVTWGNPGYGAIAETPAGLDEGVVRIWGTERAFAALKSNGSVIAWGSPAHGGDSGATINALNGAVPVTRIYPGVHAFAALRADGSVVTWGDPLRGGNSDSVASALDGSVAVVDIFSIAQAFAALRIDGSVVTWGSCRFGGCSPGAELNGGIPVTQIAGSYWGAFAALRSDGSVVSWGPSFAGGRLSEVASELDGSVPAVALWATNDAFAALRDDGSVVTWGNLGGDSSAVSDAINGSVKVIELIPSAGAFAAIREDGSVVSWTESFGGDSEAVKNELNGAVNVVSIVSTDRSFAALREDGSVISWGQNVRNHESVSSALNGEIEVISVASNAYAFAAIREDGSVFTWGDGSRGGNSETVTSQLDGSVDIVQVTGNKGAFAALREDGSVIAWGDDQNGGDHTNIRTEDGSVSLLGTCDRGLGQSCVTNAHCGAGICGPESVCYEELSDALPNTPEAQFNACIASCIHNEYTNSTTAHSCNNSPSCRHGCLMRLDGLSVDECESYCDPDEGHECVFSLEGRLYLLCGDCVGDRGFAFADQCIAGCRF